MHRITIIIIVLALLSSCASTDSDTNQTLGGLATVSALLVALPLIPFTEAYHAINDTEGKLIKEREHLEQRFDPVYAERTKLIEARDPAADATVVLNQGNVVFLPSVPKARMIPGIPYQESIEAIDFDLNQSIINNSEFLTYLLTLMDKDPIHESEGKFYFGEQYKIFIQAGFTYKEAFNQVMYSKLGATKSFNKSRNPTATPPVR